MESTDHDTKPYVIIIQLPQANEKKKYHSYERKDVVESPQNNDYIDDADELKVYQLNH